VWLLRPLGVGVSLLGFFFPNTGAPRGYCGSTAIESFFISSPRAGRLNRREVQRRCLTPLTPFDSHDHPCRAFICSPFSPCSGSKARAGCRVLRSCALSPPPEPLSELPALKERTDLGLEFSFLLFLLTLASDPFSTWCFMAAGISSAHYGWDSTFFFSSPPAPGAFLELSSRFRPQYLLYLSPPQLILHC